MRLHINNFLCVSTSRNQKFIGLIDSLIKKIPSQADLLLDMRLALSAQAEPGFWVTSYFKLSKQLSGWYRKDLDELRDLLESSIQLEIVIEESRERSRQCLKLGANHDLQDYCEDQMKRVSLHFREATHIMMGFCWSEAA